jgi:hypothetical protein
MEGMIREVGAQQGQAGLWLHIFYCPRELTWVAFADLQVVRPASQSERSE